MEHTLDLSLIHIYRAAAAACSFLALSLPLFVFPACMFLPCMFPVPVFSALCLCLSFIAIYSTPSGNLYRARRAFFIRLAGK